MPTKRINELNENYPHFLTMTTIEWIDIFTKPQYFKIVLDSLKYCQQKKGLEVHEYVIMTNHIHLIARAREGYKLSQIISDFKKHTTREILKELKIDNRRYIISLLANSFSRKEGYENQIWQRENYPEVIVSDDFLRQKTSYIYNNPVRKGYVAEAEDWLYSSAHEKVCGYSFF